MKIAAAVDTAVHFVEQNPRTVLCVVIALAVLAVLF